MKHTKHTVNSALESWNRLHSEEQAYQLGEQVWVQPMPEEVKAWPLHDGCDDICIPVPPEILYNLEDGGPLDAYCLGAIEAAKRLTGFRGERLVKWT